MDKICGLLARKRAQPQLQGTFTQQPTMQQPIDPEALLTALKESLNPSEDNETPSSEPATPMEIQIDRPNYLG